MKIGVMSDTHGSLHFFQMALGYMKDCDMIIHAGDVLYHGPRNDIPGGYAPKNLAIEINMLPEIMIVAGNCDSPVDQMVIDHPFETPYGIYEEEGLKILVSHGYLEDQNERVIMAKNLGANMVISGHTHVKKLEVVDGVVVMNPGSTSIPKDGSRSIGIIDDQEIVLLDIESGKITHRLEDYLEISQTDQL